jgi:NAD(P)H-flavin reductase
MPNTDSNPLDSLFDSIRYTLRQYKTAREGSLLVDCLKYLNDGGAQEFKIFICGSHSSCYCSLEHLQDYMSRRYPEVVLSEDELLVEKAILEILSRTGYGSVVAGFQKLKRRRSEFICKVTVSYRCVISS